MATILIAEDHDDLRAMYETRLRHHGFATRPCRNGREVLELLEAEAIDLLLLDMNMPELDGWQTTAAIRSNASLTNLPIIALTAYALEGDRARAIQAGCNDFLCKPVDFEKVLGAIAALLQKPAGAPPPKSMPEAKADAVR